MIETNSDIARRCPVEFIHSTVEYLYALCIMHRIAVDAIRRVTAAVLKLIIIEIDANGLRARANHFRSVITSE